MIWSELLENRSNTNLPRLSSVQAELNLTHPKHFDDKKPAAISLFLLAPRGPGGQGNAVLTICRTGDKKMPAANIAWRLKNMRGPDATGTNKCRER